MDRNKLISISKHLKGNPSHKNFFSPLRFHEIFMKILCKRQFGIKDVVIESCQQTYGLNYIVIMRSWWPTFKLGLRMFDNRKKVSWKYNWMEIRMLLQKVFDPNVCSLWFCLAGYLITFLFSRYLIYTSSLSRKKSLCIKSLPRFFE